jgi:hypothetical protein
MIDDMGRGELYVVIRYLNYNSTLSGEEKVLP